MRSQSEKEREGQWKRKREALLSLNVVTAGSKHRCSWSRDKNRDKRDDRDERVW